jgi:hypothetical protein
VSKYDRKSKNKYMKYSETNMKLSK